MGETTDSAVDSERSSKLDNIVQIAIGCCVFTRDVDKGCSIQPRNFEELTDAIADWAFFFGDKKGLSELREKDAVVESAFLTEPTHQRREKKVLDYRTRIDLAIPQGLLKALDKMRALQTDGKISDEKAATVSKIQSGVFDQVMEDCSRVV